jgi:hypothetical protein
LEIKNAVPWPFPFMGLFCEDVREEKAGTRTLVGVLPDNLFVGTPPSFLPKLFVYFHIHLDYESSVRSIKARIKFPGGPTVEIATFDELIEPVRADAKAKGMPFAGLIATGGLIPVPITQLGKIEAVVEVDGTEYVCGALNLVQVHTHTPIA